jgi:hypothetical protein
MGLGSRHLPRALVEAMSHGNFESFRLINEPATGSSHLPRFPLRNAVTRARHRWQHGRATGCTGTVKYDSCVL